MNDKELIARLIELAEWADANEWEVPVDLGDTIMEAVERLKQRRWNRPESPPEIGKRVLICREKEPGELIVEQAWLTRGGWWKVFGTNCKRILAWRPMPKPPEVNKI